MSAVSLVIRASEPPPPRPDRVKGTLVELRTWFWVPRGRQYVKFVIHHCLVCKKMTGASCDKPPPGDLPSFRLCEVLSFTIVGMDMAGPLFIKVPGSNQKSSTQKVWICLFTCGSSRAVHLEIVPTMNTDAFIRCLSRFCSRRGTPSMIISDNAKSFNVASKLLLKLFQSPEVQAFLTKKRIVWKFILEKSPWMGGFYERMVGFLKRILRKILANARLDYEELLTVVTEVESILNSRPISYVYTEETEEPICPSHLVTGKRLTALPEYQETDLLPDNESLVTLTPWYRYVCTLLKHFWNRFSREYLVDLREYHRCNMKKGGSTRKKPETVQIAENDVVILHDENLPRSQWRLGRVEKLIRGDQDIGF